MKGLVLRKVYPKQLLCFQSQHSLSMLDVSERLELRGILYFFAMPLGYVATALYFGRFLTLKLPLRLCLCPTSFGYVASYGSFGRRQTSSLLPASSDFIRLPCQSGFIM